MLPIFLIAVFSVSFAAEPAVLYPGQVYRATEKVFVLPESMFDTCLSKAQALEETQVLLNECVNTAEGALQDAVADLDSCSNALRNEQNNGQELLVRYSDLRKKQLRRIGFSILSGVVLGSAMTIALHD